VIGNTVWCKFLTEENIDKFDKFLSICQHFPYQNFPLIIFCRLPARPLFTQGIIASIRSHEKFFLVQIRQYISTTKWKNIGLAIATRAFQTDQQSGAITSMVAT